jgi:hypothetical protein
MNDDVSGHDENPYMGDPTIAIARAEDGETPSETHDGTAKDDRSDQ